LFFSVTWPCSFTTLRHVNRNSCIIIIIIIIYRLASVVNVSSC